MTVAPDRVAMTASACAVAAHLVLFVGVRPSNNGAGMGRAVVPKTLYLSQASEGSSMAGGDVRTVQSPVIFSLPSDMGFSRAHLQQPVQTPRFLLQPPRPDSFLEVDLAAQDGRESLSLNELMLTAGEGAAPGLPADVFPLVEKRPAARRVHLAPELRERLVGGIVLPTELNRAVAAPWEVHATISVSGQGNVEHVFLDQPLDAPTLNRQVLRLLYGLQFQAGGRVEGGIEIYSPDAGAAEVEK